MPGEHGPARTQQERPLRSSSQELRGVGGSSPLPPFLADSSSQSETVSHKSLWQAVSGARGHQEGRRSHAKSTSSSWQPGSARQGGAEQSCGRWVSPSVLAAPDISPSLTLTQQPHSV